jgi:hypothetical protein
MFWGLNKRIDMVIGICYDAIMRWYGCIAPRKGCMMGKQGKVRLTWAPRVKQPKRAVKVMQFSPGDEMIFGPPISQEELRARVVNGKVW